VEEPAPAGIDEWKTASPLRKIERKGESNLVDRSKKTTKNLTPIGRVDPNGFAALLGTDVDEEDLAGVGSGNASVDDAPPSSTTPSETEPTSTRSGFRFGKFCSTKLLCVFLIVVVGLGCSAFAPSSYGSGGVSELLESVFVPDTVLDLSNTTSENEFSPMVRGTALASSAVLPTETETARGALFASFNPAPDHVVPDPVVPDPAVPDPVVPGASHLDPANPFWFFGPTLLLGPALLLTDLLPGAKAQSSSPPPETYGSPLLIHPNGPAKKALMPSLRRILDQQRAAETARKQELTAVKSGSDATKGPSKWPSLETSSTGLWNGTACGQFEVQSFRSGRSFVTNTKETCSGGQQGRACAGGQWSACTHLKLYGLNTAPFLLRLLALGLQPQSALEIGCGLGTAADFLARFVPGGSHVTCVEPEQMLAEVFGRRSLPQRPSQLAVNLFGADGPSRSCLTELQTRRFDLVYSLEVAEHIDPAARPKLVQLISASTGKLLVFSAARPHQAGTGHIAESSLTRRQWISLFEGSGLVLLPKLSALASRAAYPDRAYDISPNVFVMRAAAATDVDEAEIESRVGSLLDRTLLFSKESLAGAANANWSAEIQDIDASGRSLVGRAAIKALRKMISSIRPQVHLYEGAVWPELTLLQQQIANGRLRC